MSGPSLCYVLIVPDVKAITVLCFSGAWCVNRDCVVFQLCLVCGPLLCCVSMVSGV